MKRIALLALVAAIVGLGIYGCGGSTPPLNTTPSVTTILPNSAVAGGGAFTLTVDGSNFVAASVITFGGTAAATKFVSATQLTAAIPAALVASAGTLAVTVSNPAPGGSTSNAVNFTITGSPNPVPTISSLSPSCAPNGEQAFNLLVNGLNFVAGSGVQWNGTDRPTAFLDVGRLEAQIPATDIAAAGTAAVTVFNPAPGGGSSNTTTFTINPGGVDPQSISVDPTGTFAYVANTGCPDAFAGYVSMYTIKTSTGGLVVVGPPVPTQDEGARSVTVDHFGKFAYVVNWGEGDTAGSISMYTINATTGALVFTGTINGMCPGLCAPYSVAVDPSGRFVYVANEGGPAPTAVSMYKIDATTGALTSIGTIPTAGRAISVAVDPTGKFAYVATKSDPPGATGHVSMYTIDVTTGALTSGGMIAAGTDPAFVAADPAGKFVYVTNSGSNEVSMYTIDAITGTLTYMGLVAAGTGPASLAVDPATKFAYVVNSGSNDVSMYRIDAISGTLTSTGTIAAGSTPTSIAIDPSGSFAYVTNSGSNSVSMYTIDPANGSLTLIGTVGT